MARHFSIEFTKTYATPANAQKAVEKTGFHQDNKLQYTILPVETEKGIRYGVLFFGQSACQAGVHFHFNVVALG
jgi:hypothetical protein